MAELKSILPMMEDFMRKYGGMCSGNQGPEVTSITSDLPLHDVPVDLPGGESQDGDSLTCESDLHELPVTSAIVETRKIFGALAPLLPSHFERNEMVDNAPSGIYMFSKEIGIPKLS